MTSPQENQHLIQWFRENFQNLQSVGDGSDYFGINIIHIHDHFIRTLLRRIQFDSISAIYKDTGQRMYPEMCIMTEWPIGGFQDPHKDTYSSAELQYGLDDANAPPRREWTLILNLNSNFGDGKTYFPDDDYTHDPVSGQGVLFQGLYHEHGVQKVRRCPRYTIAMWFSGDTNNMMTDMVTDDLREDQFSLLGMQLPTRQSQ